ncbi:plant/F14N23-31 protein [Senna tora]|uniref:Plant/F14N23-31 protein n=1 Tax=Senna tora TaxID=362788 RepID=A0A835C931_9FABA|nr:plant/F14N23-31 protein [Senna tora]
MLSSSWKKQSHKRKIDGLRRRVSFQTSKGSLDKKTITPGVPDCYSFANPTFHRGIEETWFDSVAVFDSNCDNDYQSVADDVVSLNGSEGERDNNLWYERVCVNASWVCGTREVELLQEEAESQNENRWSLRRHGLIQMLNLILIVMMTTRLFLMMFYLSMELKVD